MRGIISYGGYVPYHRLERAAIAAAHGGAPGKGTRAVASYDEDTTSMGVEAARQALRPLGPDAADRVEQLWFATTSPSYADKTNATTVHAALRLGRDVPAFDAVGSVRAAAGTLRAALAGGGTTLVVGSDARTGLPNSADEREGGDGAAALLIGDDGADGAPSVLAEYLGGASTTEEFVDRWRVPGDVRSRQWEERFGEMRYVPLGTEAWKLALDRAGVAPEQVAKVVVAGPHARAVRQVGAKIGAATGGIADDLATTVGNTGAAHPALALARVLDDAEPGQVLALVVLADGCDVFLFRATDALAAFTPQRPVAHQIETGQTGLLYAKFLSWTGMLQVQPPNRPEPARASSSAAARNEGWKFGFVGSTDHDTGAVHLPRGLLPGWGHRRHGASTQADVEGTIVTFTVDRLAYSPSPPIVFSVVDFDGGGRLRSSSPMSAGGCPDRRPGRDDLPALNQSDGIQNYFWKAKPVR
jgi:3-hydroxy-3-methylglutaryl CoA synthase